MNPAQVIREKTSRLTDGRVACALVLDRDLASDELSRFLGQTADEEPLPSRFSFEERVVRYECRIDDESKWRLAFEIFLAKSCAPRDPGTLSGRRPTDTRGRVGGLRKLHLG